MGGLTTNFIGWYVSISDWKLNLTEQISDIAVPYFLIL